MVKTTLLRETATYRFRVAAITGRYWRGWLGWSRKNNSLNTREEAVYVVNVAQNPQIGLSLLIANRDKVLIRQQATFAAKPSAGHSGNA